MILMFEKQPELNGGITQMGTLPHHSSPIPQKFLHPCCYIAAVIHGVTSVLGRRTNGWTWGGKDARDLNGVCQSLQACLSFLARKSEKKYKKGCIYYLHISARNILII